MSTSVAQWVVAQVTSERLGWVLVHSLWQFAAIAVAVRVIESRFTVRSGAAARYWVGVVGLVAVTVVPMVTWMMLADAATVSEVMAVTAPTAEQAASGPATAPQDSIAIASTERHAASATHATLAERFTATRSQVAIWLQPWLPTLVGCWLAGMSLCSLRPAIGWYMLRRLRTVGVAPLGPLVQGTTRELAARLGVSQAIAVLSSTLTPSPILVGYLRPVLLLPVGLVSQLPPAELEAILAHELAHVRRHDFLINVWQVVLETVFFYHPAVWVLSRRIRAERENCCDDLALAATGDAVGYGRALLHVEEFCAGSSVFALSASGGSLTARIQRLFAPPAAQSSFPGFLLGVLMPSLSLAVLFAALAWGQTEKPAEAEKGAKPVSRSLDIVIAQHAIIWDNRVRTWDEVATELREIRKAEGKPIHPHFYFTNAAHAAGHWDTYKAKAFELYKDLFEPAGMSLGSISPRAGARYDVIRKTEDFIPDPKTLRSGVVTVQGQPKVGALVVLVPQEGQMPVMLKPDLSLRDPLDEVWTLTDDKGRFTLNVQPPHATDKLTEPPVYSIAAITSTSYQLAKVPEAGKEVAMALEPLVQLELTPVEGLPQRIDLSFRGGLPDASPGFSIYEIAVRDKPVTVAVPPGEVTVSRSFPHKDGGSRSYPSETLQTKSGDRKVVLLPNISEREAEKRWMEDSIRSLRK